MGIATFNLEDIACPTCISKVKKGVRKQRGVERITMLIDSGQMKINYDVTITRPDEIKKGISKLKFRSFD